ncbi:hypothetical protein QCBJ_26885 [Pseudomonas sp. QC2]|nr:hypothetical protein QCBJ_26885 [Pseudomonas sp. QC2]
MCSEQAWCGEQACPALGREAAPKPANQFCLKERGAWVRAASQPSAGQAYSLHPPCFPILNCGVSTIVRLPLECPLHFLWLLGRSCTSLPAAGSMVFS